MRKLLPHLAVLFFILFGTLAVLVLSVPSIIQPIDTFVHALIVPFQTSLGIQIFEDITFFGGTVGVILSLVAIVLIFRHRPDVIFRLLVAVIGTTISAEYLKILFARVRPTVFHGLAAVHSYSFPSGHANDSVVLYGYLALLLLLHVRSLVWRRISVLLCATAIFLIGLSRIVLQYHFATDVLGGYFLGAFWLTFSLAIPLWYPLYHYNENHSEPLDRPLL